jgi:hypothetical protein
MIGPIAKIPRRCVIVKLVMSLPAQNALSPAPVRITTRTCGSASASVNKLDQSSHHRRRDIISSLFWSMESPTAIARALGLDEFG